MRSNTSAFLLTIPQIQKREREARRDIINNSQPRRRDLQIHTIEAKKKIETIAKVSVDQGTRQAFLSRRTDAIQ